MLTAVFICGYASFGSQAYFDRGTVKVSLGKTSISLKQKETEKVTVSLSPKSDRQLPGCGMAECPQSCGEKDCLDENGECTCNGTTYKTYKAYAEVSSSNTSVATASYDNGVITIKGISPGTATISVVGCLRQFTNSPAKTIKVTVSKAVSDHNSGSVSDSESSSGSGNSHSGDSLSNLSGHSGSQSGSKDTVAGNSSGGNKSNNGKVTKVEPNTSSQEEAGNNTVSGKNGSDATKEDSSQEKPQVLESDRGKITFVQIQAGKMGKDALASIKGKNEYVNFQKKDDSDNVLYAWEFLGTDIKEVMDVDYEITADRDPFLGCSYGSASDSLYLNFAHEGDLPGKASVFLRLNDSFQEKDILNLYYFDEKSGEISLVSEGLKPQNGYVTLSLSHCSKYILTTETFANVKEEASAAEDQSSASSEESTPAAGTGVKQSSVAVIIIIIAAAAAMIGGMIWKKRKSESC